MSIDLNFRFNIQQYAIPLIAEEFDLPFHGPTNLTLANERKKDETALETIVGEHDGDTNTDEATIPAHESFDRPTNLTLTDERKKDETVLETIVDEHELDADTNADKVRIPAHESFDHPTNSTSANESKKDGTVFETIVDEHIHDADTTNADDAAIPAPNLNSRNQETPHEDIHNAETNDACKSELSDEKEDVSSHVLMTSTDESCLQNTNKSKKDLSADNKKDTVSESDTDAKATSNGKINPAQVVVELSVNGQQKSWGGPGIPSSVNDDAFVGRNSNGCTDVNNKISTAIS